MVERNMENGKIILFTKWVWIVWMDMYTQIKFVFIEMGWKTWLGYMSCHSHSMPFSIKIHSFYMHEFMCLCIALNLLFMKFNTIFCCWFSFSIHQPSDSLSLFFSFAFDFLFFLLFDWYERILRCHFCFYFCFEYEFLVVFNVIDTTWH